MSPLIELALPIALTWARNEERKILRRGEPLNDAQMNDARRIGIAQPERVRLCLVDSVPPGIDPVMRLLARSFGMSFNGTIGMALGHGIYLQREHATSRALLIHELAHVAQYERLGLREFLRQYLRECLREGYPLGALEVEARAVTESLSA